MTAAVDKEAAKVLMLWFWLFIAAPWFADSLSVGVDCGAASVVDIVPASSAQAVG